MPITRRPFGHADDGRQVDVYTLSAPTIEVEIMTYGAAVIALRVPDRRGAPAEVVLGFDTFGEYLKDRNYFGAVIGRYANRITEGRVCIGERHFQLTRNCGRDHLHGGVRGFDKVVWDAEIDRERLVLSYLSRDGEEGYPGNLRATAIYSLPTASELKIELGATTDQDTVVNLTQHPYFNLDGAEDLSSHTLWICSRAFLPIDNRILPTGEQWAVTMTPMDFQAPAAIGPRLQGDHPQLALAGGFDHTWILNKPAGDYAYAAEICGQQSGRRMSVFTSQPGLHVYTANAFDGIQGKLGSLYRRHCGLCIETQHFPDAPNHPNFPGTLLKAGECLLETTSFQFANG